MSNYSFKSVSVLLLNPSLPTDLFMRKSHVVFSLGFLITELPEVPTFHFELCWQ